MIAACRTAKHIGFDTVMCAMSVAVCDRNVRLEERQHPDVLETCDAEAIQNCHDEIKKCIRLCSCRTSGTSFSAEGRVVVKFASVGDGMVAHFGIVIASSRTAWLALRFVISGSGA